MSIFSTFNMLTWKQTDAFTLTLTKYDHNNESAVEQRSFYLIWTSEEISMLKSCQYCQKIHDSKYNCHMKPVKKNHRTECDRFRYTSAWQQKREEIKERDRYLCQVCIRNLYDTTRKFNSNDLSVHHANKLNDAYAVSSQVADYFAELDAEYAKAYVEAEKSIKGQIGLFNELEVKSDLTVEKMADNMQKQAEIMTTYNDDLQKAMELVSDGKFSREFLNEIEQMGIEGAGYLHEIVKAAETNSQDFIELMEAWKERAASIDILSHTRADVETSCNKIKESMLSASDEAVDGMEAKLVWGLVGLADKAAKEGERIGLDTGEGVIRGLSRKMREAATVAANGMLSVYDAMKKALDIHSPSKKTEYLGEETGEGYIIGTVETLEEGKEEIHEALDDLLEHDYKDVTDGQAEVAEAVEELTTAFTSQSSVLADAGNAMLDYMLLGVELDESVEKTAERVDKLKETYSESKKEAEESISSQVKLFDKLEMKSDVTLKDMIESLRSQTKYFYLCG